jgi:type I restriction enzyme S subunit
MNLDSLLDNFELLLNSKNGLQRIRNLVRDLALRGTISSEEIFKSPVGHASPASLPKSWRWVKIDEVSDFVNGFAFRSDEYVSQGVGVVRMSDMKNGKISPEGMKFVSEERLKSLDVSFQIKPDDIVMGMTGATLGKPCVNKTKDTFLLNQRIGKFIPKGINRDYFLLALSSLESSFMELSFGTGVNNLSTKQIKESLIPLPSEPDQVQIVKLVSDIHQQCDELESALTARNEFGVQARKSLINAVSTLSEREEIIFHWEVIQKNWDLVSGSRDSLDLLRTLILDLAVRGDLASSGTLIDDNIIDWNAQDLKLDQTRIWHLPTLSLITRSGWNRLPLARLGQWGSGGTPTASNKKFYEDGTIPWAVIGDLNNEIMYTTQSKITESALIESSSKMVPIGSVLIAMYGASIGKTAITGIECCTNQAIAHCIVDTDVVSKEYFFMLAKSLKRHLIQQGKGAAQPNISQSILKHLVIDLPPKTEQAMIVETVDALFGMCDELETSLAYMQDLVEKYINSALSTSN